MDAERIARKAKAFAEALEVADAELEGSIPGGLLAEYEQHVKEVAQHFALDEVIQDEMELSQRQAMEGYGGLSQISQLGLDAYPG